VKAAEAPNPPAAHSPKRRSNQRSDRKWQADHGGFAPQRTKRIDRSLVEARIHAYQHWQFCLQTRENPASFVGSDGFKGTAGDVRFIKETLGKDHDGDGSADFAVLMSGVNSLKGSNLIL
jgi:hypothetical protein